VGRAVFEKVSTGMVPGATERRPEGRHTASAIWRLEERVGTGAFEACLQGQHWGSGVLPVVALSEGVASPHHEKLVRGGSPE